MFGICTLSAISVRKEPRHESELVTELLFNDLYEVLEKNGDWLYIKMEYDGYDTKKESITVKYNKDVYAMLPVWYFTSKWGDKDYCFAMNGQTGKLIGDLPMSVPKFIITVLIAFLVPFLGAYFLMDAAGVGAIFGIVIAAIGLWLYYLVYSVYLDKILEVLAPFITMQGGYFVIGLAITFYATALWPLVIKLTESKK